jgi:ribonuclease ZC3H12
VVLDAANVAMYHGKCEKFSTRGIALALEFFEKRGFRAVAVLSDKFVPEKYFDAQSGKWLWRTHGREGRNKPDNPGQLLSWKDADKVYTTPPGTYDDAFSISFAREKDAIILSNDRYRDIIAQQPDANKQSEYRTWIATHVCKYAFIDDTLVPDPDWFPSS